MIKKFPKELFVRIEDAGNEEFYFLAEDKFEAHAELGSVRQVGIYQLKETANIETFVVKNKQEF